MSDVIAGEQKKAFDQFQLEEYKNISTSHFESVKQISTFFRYYLLLLSAPALVLTIIGDELNEFFGGNSNIEYYNIVFFYLLIISLAGFCLFLYILNVRHDAILYAKTVNKVRRYFYDNSNLSIEEFESYLGLPIVTIKPSYFDRTIFLPLVLVFALVNSGFLYAAFYFRRLCSEYIFLFSYVGDFKISSAISYISLLFLITHFGMWFWLSQHRENKYLQSYRIGVDIDGVLNEQTDHFIKWLYIMTGKKIAKEEILEIPVHLNKNLNVSEYEEWLVFNCREYWETLPQKENAFYRLKTLQKTFGYDLRIFSYRPWPIYGTKKKEISKVIKDKGYTPLKRNEISKVTKTWLKTNGLNTILIDKRFKAFLNYINPLKIFPILTIEKGNPYVTDHRFFFILRKQLLLINRFQGSKTKKIKFFFEDTPENAIKLSRICDYVFLLQEPYNNENRYKYPKNIIMVDSWNDVYRWFKALS
nr:hypothetical protein [uncultured Allomuricauda sp.]